MHLYIPTLLSAHEEHFAIALFFPAFAVFGEDSFILIKTYDFESVGNNANCHQLLSVVASIHHERVGQTLDDGALGFPEPLDGISAGGVRDVDGGTDLDVVARLCKGMC